MGDIAWIRASQPEKRPIWGHPNGIQVSLWPCDAEGRPGNDGGPRGLLRIGYPVLPITHAAGLINFIAIEPVVKGVRCYSELEPSTLREGRGKFIWSGTRGVSEEKFDQGTLSLLPGTFVEVLRVNLFVEPFVNKARVQLRLEFRSDKPDEVAITSVAQPGSASMDNCILTATMGNYMRLRRVWLKDHQASPLDLWPQQSTHPNGFTDDLYLPAAALLRDASGGVLACAESNEIDPAAAPPDPQAPWWHFRGAYPLTQYWRYPDAKTAGTVKLRLNGRKVYWAGTTPIPGGLAFENFDLTAPFVDSQTFIFGLAKDPAPILIRRFQSV